MITLLTALSASLSAAPVGFSVNSDSPSDDSDGLYLIDLATGTVQDRVSTIVQTPSLLARIDVEGLAFGPDGQTLYAIDDDSLKFFALDTDFQNYAVVDSEFDYRINELSNGNNDFGMTFACDEQLYITSVSEQSLYRLDSEGKATLVGGSEKGKLGKNISALAAYGFPVQLYGLGNGTVGDNATQAPALFKIDTATGIATQVGLLTGAFGAYSEAGLAFDADGDLWAITDRRTEDQPSQVLKIDKDTGNVTLVNNIVAPTPDEAKGFESLAITGPQGCTDVGNGRSATFFVQKRFDDGNNITPVTLNFQCTGGTVFNGTKTLFPGEDTFGIYTTSFTVSNLPDAAISCDVTEQAPAGYLPEYSCQSGNSCTSNEGVGPCTFNNVIDGQRDLCLINNQPQPVELTVTKEWVYVNEETMLDEEATVVLECTNVVDGDGEDFGTFMRWFWNFKEAPSSGVANLVPHFDGTTLCSTDEGQQPSSIESEGTCEEPVAIEIGDEKRECVVTNTVFFEGIPTLDRSGLLLITVLTLITGLVAVRRLG